MGEPSSHLFDDPRNFEAQVEQAKANLAAAEAHVATVEADLNNQLASLQSARANMEAAKVARLVPQGRDDDVGPEPGAIFAYP